jgi:hypothetical protein
MEVLLPQIRQICVDNFSIAAKLYSGTDAFSCLSEIIFEVRCAPIVRFALETLPNWRSLQSQIPPGYTYQRPRRGTTLSLAFAQSGTPVFPRSCSPPSGATRITSCRAGGGGPIERTRTRSSRSWRHPRIQSSARTRPVRPSRWVCTSSSWRRTRCTRTWIPASRSLFAIVCTTAGFKQNCQQF